METSDNMNAAKSAETANAANTAETTETTKSTETTDKTTLKSITEAIPNQFGKNPERILQFGEGNFLRAFVDWMVELCNRKGLLNSSIVIVQPIENGLADIINEQNGQYTLVMSGLENGEPKREIMQLSSVSRCLNPYRDWEDYIKIAENPDLQFVVSNTTEAGIAYSEGDQVTDKPASSFPAKVAQFLHHRFQHFQGDPTKGLIFLPVELIDDNGHHLREIVTRYAKEWNLGDDFLNWLANANEFTSTLVDRIVTGRPQNQQELEEELGYQDKLIVTSEVFNLWVIEGSERAQSLFPVAETEANVIWTQDVKPYKLRKVRILNGGHTGTVLAGIVGGHEIVREMCNDPIYAAYFNKLMFEEIIPTIDLPRAEIEQFANDVLDRFRNPYINHKLLDISLNSISKYNARVLPSLLDSIEANGKVPEALSFSLAALIRFYLCREINGQYEGTRDNGSHYPIHDTEEVIQFFAELSKSDSTAGVAEKTLAKAAFWSNRDLTEVPGLLQAVEQHLSSIMTNGVNETLKGIVTK